MKLEKSFKINQWICTLLECFKAMYYGQNYKLQSAFINHVLNPCLSAGYFIKIQSEVDNFKFDLVFTWTLIFTDFNTHNTATLKKIYCNKVIHFEIP